MICTNPVSLGHKRETFQSTPMFQHHLFLEWNLKWPFILHCSIDSAFLQFYMCESNPSTGCPESSFLHFISLYFSTIGLGKEIISTKVVSFNIIHYFHTLCAIFWLEYSICVLPRQRCACASIFPATYFLYFIARIARTPSLFFVNIMKDKPP